MDTKGRGASMGGKWVVVGLAVLTASLSLVAGSSGSPTAHQATLVNGPNAGHEYGGQVPHNGPLLEVRISASGRTGYLHAKCGTEIVNSPARRFVLTKSGRVGFTARAGPRPSVRLAGVFHTVRGRHELTGIALVAHFTKCANSHGRVHLLLDKKVSDLKVPVPPPPPPPPGKKVDSHITITSGCPADNSHPKTGSTITLTGTLSPSFGASDPLTASITSGTDQTFYTDTTGNFTALVRMPSKPTGYQNLSVKFNSDATRNSAYKACPYIFVVVN